MAIGSGKIKVPQFEIPVSIRINATVTDDIIDFRNGGGEPVVFLSTHNTIDKLRSVYGSRLVTDKVPEVKIEILGQYKHFMNEITGINHVYQMAHWDQMEELHLILFYGIVLNEKTSLKLKKDDLYV